MGFGFLWSTKLKIFPLSQTHHWKVAKILILIFFFGLVLCGFRWNKKWIQIVLCLLWSWWMKICIHISFLLQLLSYIPMVLLLLLVFMSFLNVLFVPIQCTLQFTRFVLLFFFASWVGLELDCIQQFWSRCLFVFSFFFVLLRFDCSGKCTILFRFFWLDFVLWILCFCLFI